MIQLNIFKWRLYLRILILLGICLLTGLVFLNEDWIFTQIILFLLIVLSTIDLNRYLHKTNRDLTRLLEALHYEEYATSFAEKNGGSRYSELNQKMEEIKLKNESRTKQHRQTFKLYEQILNQLDHGIMLFDQNQHILMQNESAANLLNLAKIKDLTSIKNQNPGLLKKIEAANDHAQFVLNNDNIICHVSKFKSNSLTHTLLILSAKGSGESGSDFEAWVNFSKVISHEILNSLSPIISLTNTLQDQVKKLEDNERLKESMQKALNIITDRCQSLQTYSERYRTLQRLPEPNTETLQWSKVINKTIGIHQSSLDENNIQVTLEGNALEASFKADSWQMDQVFSNLFLNSIHALEKTNEQHKQISIKAETEGMYDIITFSDNGSGIEKSNRANIFLPFFSTREGGSGIGLSVVKQILWKHHAEIFLSNTETGATFVIRFPKV